MDTMPGINCEIVYWNCNEPYTGGSATLPQWNQHLCNPASPYTALNFQGINATTGQFANTTVWEQGFTESPINSGQGGTWYGPCDGTAADNPDCGGGGTAHWGVCSDFQDTTYWGNGPWNGNYWEHPNYPGVEVLGWTVNGPNYCGEFGNWDLCDPGSPGYNMF